MDSPSTGVCWGNAAAESFFASLKNECYHRRRHETRARARFTVAEYIEVFYNRKRLHNSLGKLLRVMTLVTAEGVWGEGTGLPAAG